MKRSVLYDFHGTFADVRTVQHFLADNDFEGFYKASLGCPPIEMTVLGARHSHEAGYVNILFTGMTENHKEGLQGWLDRHAVPIDIIAMRPLLDRRKDFVVKREMYLQAMGDGYQILRAWDDSPACLDLWRHQGIPVVRVPGYVEVTRQPRVDKL